ncbi:crotonase/enoyl-CoA hydratase family protein [Pseudorhizobium flavum]|uniref:Enoyl-CoA hydratase/carnithine racemase n=1 Tax=Pseudorhizobium flavum TaxID=1335061 RepID=A0A7W9Z0Z1_9HYPH|nr:crotonase/enoyl-CoA hydratase family protein [Pseudorhizobium flavum]MBB6181156.1 enoyl-CoA hydratase/carnithine racemase [Pseudorhizobium flavum]CAD6600519.1 enoyl-CoA hydratase [Pseudorhizobium flavum]
MSDNHILVERPDAQPGVLVIRLNRPEKKNAITTAMYARMTEALHEADNHAEIRAVAFLGTDNCFSAGNDMADFLTYAMGGGGRPSAADFLQALATCDKPMVSGVDGLAIGIGTTIHLHCDMTIASDRSLFRTPFVDLALVPEAASSLIAPRVMGHQRAFALLAAGESFSAEPAREAGIVWKVVSPDAVEAETLALAANLAAKPPHAMKIARNLIRGNGDDVLARMDEELVHFTAQLRSAEARAAFEAFMRR